jgi:hypothetical protein
MNRNTDNSIEVSSLVQNNQNNQPVVQQKNKDVLNIVFLMILYLVQG